MNSYAYTQQWNAQDALHADYWNVWVNGSTIAVRPESNQITINEWVPETIIGNKVIGYSGDSPTIETEDTYLDGLQYNVEVGKSYVVQNNMVVGHPCFMPDVRVSYKMSGMDEYDINANGIYTQNDFFSSGQHRTWSNEKGYTIKYDYMAYQWVCTNQGGGMVAQGGYEDNPAGGSWYEMVNWSGNEVTLELYEE